MRPAVSLGVSRELSGRYTGGFVSWACTQSHTLKCLELFSQALYFAPYAHLSLHAEAFYDEARAPDLQLGAAITGFATLQRKS